MDDTAAWFEEISGEDYDREIVSRSRQLTEEIRRVARESAVWCTSMLRRLPASALTGSTSPSTHILDSRN